MSIHQLTIFTLSTHPYIYQTTNQSIHLSSTLTWSLTRYLPIYLLIHLSIIFPTLHQPTYLSAIHLSIHPLTPLLPTNLSIVHPSSCPLYLGTYPPVHPIPASTLLSIDPSILPSIFPSLPQPTYHPLNYPPSYLPLVCVPSHPPATVLNNLVYLPSHLITYISTYLGNYIFTYLATCLSIHALTKASDSLLSARGIVTPSELLQVRRRATSSAPRGFSVTSASPSLPVALLVLSAAAGCLHSQADVSRGLCPRVLSLNRRLSPHLHSHPPASSAKTSTCAPTCSLARSLARHQLS